MKDTDSLECTILFVTAAGLFATGHWGWGAVVISVFGFFVQKLK